MFDAKQLIDQFLGGSANNGAASGSTGRGLAGGALAGGLAGLLVGTKTGRKIGKSALTYGGTALLGGLAYTAGILFYGWKKLKYHHAIWHLFVIGGSVFHFFSVMQLV